MYKTVIYLLVMVAFLVSTSGCRCVKTISHAPDTQGEEVKVAEEAIGVIEEAEISGEVTEVEEVEVKMK